MDIVHSSKVTLGFALRRSIGRVMLAMTVTVWGCEKTTAPLVEVAVDSSTHDFGERRQGEELLHTFVVTNQMDSPVKIIKAVSSCTCTVVGERGRLPDKAIPPHGTLRIPIRFHTGSAQEVASGRVLVFYRLESERADSQPKKFFPLQLRADVIPDYRIVPEELDFGEIDGLSTQRVTRTLHLTPVAVRNVLLKEVRATRDFLTTRVLPRIEGDTGFTIEVGLNTLGFDESRLINGTVVISTGSLRLPHAIVPVRVKYLAPVTIKPGMIVIGSDQEGEVERQLRVRSSCISRILSASTQADLISVAFEAHESRKHNVRVFVRPCYTCALDEELTIELELFPDRGDRSVRSFAIPIHRLLREGD